MAALWQDHEQHEKARSWLAEVRSFATCPLVQIGFARISSHPLLGYGLEPEQAFSILRRFVADPRHAFIADTLGKSPVEPNNPFRAFMPAAGPLPKKTVRPPEWIGWCLMSVGGVLILHSLAMPRPNGG